MSDGLDIRKVTGRRLYDSEGQAAVEAEVTLENGVRGRAMTAVYTVPSCNTFKITERNKIAGAVRETRAAAGEAGTAKESVTAGVTNTAGKKDKNREKPEKKEERVIEHCFEVLGECILFEAAADQTRIDRLLIEAKRRLSPERSEEKHSFLTAVSMAVSRAAAAGLGMTLYRYLGGKAPAKLPLPAMTMISGGKHGKDQTLDMEGFLVIPVGAPSFSQGIAMATEVYQTLKQLFASYGFRGGVGPDGGLVPRLRNGEKALSYLTEAIRLSGYEPGRDILLAVKSGASSLYDEEEGIYHFPGESKMTGVTTNRLPRDMAALYMRLITGFPVCAIFDGFGETDHLGWDLVIQMMGNRTSFLRKSHDPIKEEEPSAFKTASKEEIKKTIAAGGIELSINAAGCVTAAIEIAKQAKRHGQKIAVCQEQRETEDSYIADFAAAIEADWITAGAPCRTERTSKYNQLLRIEEHLRN